MSERLFIVAATDFEAARRLADRPEGDPRARLHGHSFRVGLRARPPAGWAPFPGGESGRLAEALAEAVAPLDYQSLNDRLAQPDDQSLARWIKAAVAAPGIDRIELRSAADRGATIDRQDRVHLWRRYEFHSAHRLPNVAPGHKCGRMHGHGFAAILHARRDMANAGGVDHDRLDGGWAPLHRQLHHACLNDIPGLDNPTSEMIAAWIWQRLKPELPELSWVTVYETAGCGTQFDGRRHGIWKDVSLDSAVRLRRAPEGDARRRLHGYTFTLRLHLSAPLDTVMGWAMDFGDVKELFAPVFARLDHQPLHELPGVEDNDAASLARWIKNEAAPRIPQLVRLDLYTTRDQGVTLAWSGDDPALPV